MPGGNTKRAKQPAGETCRRLPVSEAGRFSEPGIGFRELGYGVWVLWSPAFRAEMQGLLGSPHPQPQTRWRTWLPHRPAQPPGPRFLRFP